jgi:hypothetical protein
MDELPELGIDASALEQGTAAGTLNDLPRGGLVLLHVALERVEDIRTALTEGRFTDADRHVQELHAKVSPLAQAQATLGDFAARMTVMRARDIGTGAMLFGIGKVEGRETRECEDREGGESHLHVIFHIEGKEKPYEVSEVQELAVRRDEGLAGGHGDG